MPYVCLECWEVYRNEQDYCPKRSCHASPVVEIDELMFPIIKLLNDKGYSTTNCCSGHAYDECCHPYIAFHEYLRQDIFEDGELEELFSDLPNGWELEVSDDRWSFCLRNYIPHKDTIEMYEDIVNANLALLKYVDKLPPLEY